MTKTAIPLQRQVDEAYAQVMRAFPGKGDWNRLSEQYNSLFEELHGKVERAGILEQQGQIEQAIALYEESVSDEFCGIRPYDRLRILYARQNRYKDAVRACEAFLRVAETRPAGGQIYTSPQGTDDMKRHLEKLRAKVLRADSR